MSEVIVQIQQLLQSELGLADGQVMIENQRWPIPLSSGLYVFLRSMGPKPIGTKTWLDDNVSGGADEVQEATIVDLIQIDVMSDGNDPAAVQRAPEIVLALRSIASQKAQEAGGFQIARIPQSFQNVGDVEGASRMNRFTATIAVAWLSTKRKANAEYYDQITTPEVFPNV